MENNEGYKLIERLILGRRLKIQYIKLRKMYRYRKNVIAEIMKTEQSYVTDLQIIQNKLLDQLTFTKYTMENLFSNFPDIIKINDPMCADMLQRIESENKRQLQIYENEIVKIKALFPQYNKPFNYSYGHENSVIFDLMLKYTFFFDKYFPYCQSFGNAQQNRQEQLKNDPGFSEIIQQLQKDPIFRCLDLEGFMVKPVQRLPKYVLLLKDLLKHTPEYHPDYNNIQQTLAKFEQINFQNNQKMDEFLNKQKINELQQQFPSEKKILEGKKFLLEENVELFITLRDLRPVVLYLFHDLIIITEHDHSLFGADKYKVKFRIPISFQTQCLEIQESKFYKNAFKIVNQKIFQFSCSDTKSKKQLVGLINDQIQAYSAKAFEDISIDNQEVKVPPIVVKLKGTEEHNIASLNHYTVYVIQIKMDHMAWTIYNRYSQLKALYEFICLKYRNKVKFTNFLHSNWLRNHENKYLEMRKIGIENFLQQLFVSQLMQEPKPQREILERLGMPTNFFKLYQIVENDQQMRNDQQDNTIGDFNYQHENNQVIQSFLQNVQIQTILDNKLNQADQFIDIWVHVHLSKNESEQIRKYKIKSLTKSVLLCAQIASELKLDSFFDFRLFVTDSKGNTRPIECNQTLIQSLPKDPTIFNNDSPMTKVSKFFIEQFDEVYHLEFKKYVTFPPKFEAEEYNKCEIRLELITEQLFQAVQSEQYKLTPNQYALVYALYLLAKYNEQQIYEIKQTNLMHYFKYVGPRKIYKHFSKEQWKEYVNKYLDQLNKKINQIVQDKGLEQRKKSLIARKILIRSMEDVELYGCTLFYVGYDRDNVDMFEKNGIQKYFNLYIAVSFKGIYLLTPSQKDIIKKYDYKDFQKITVEPLAILFQISADNQLSFNTTDSYRIYKLIEDYKEILKYIKK